MRVAWRLRAVSLVVCLLLEEREQGNLDRSGSMKTQMDNVRCLVLFPHLGAVLVAGGCLCASELHIVGFKQRLGGTDVDVTHQHCGDDDVTSQHYVVVLS